MLHVIAPAQGERAPGARGCVDDRLHRPSASVKAFTLVLEMTGCVGVLVLLLAAQAAITAWKGCAWGIRSVRVLMTPAGRAALATVCSWRRTIYVVYLGTLASWTSSRASPTFTPERTLLRAGARASESRTGILELRKSRAMKALPKRELVLSGSEVATDSGRRETGYGDAA